METMKILNRVASHLFLTYCETGLASDKEAWCLVEEILDGETKTLVAQGTSETLVTESDNSLRDQDAGMFRDIRTSTGTQPQAQAH